MEKTRYNRHLLHFYRNLFELFDNEISVSQRSCASCDKKFTDAFFSQKNFSFFGGF
jgi:hypothetical protein